MDAKFKQDITGLKFNKLTAIRRCGTHKGQALWIFKCDCGKIKKSTPHYVRRGDTKSCGCIHTTHKYCKGGRRTTEYRTWTNIKTRCHNKSSDHFKWYGARGIKVCDRWRDSFLNFLKDMGRKPSSKHSIDRKNTNGNYTPSNCRWATNKQQANNQRRNILFNYNGKKMTISEIVDLNPNLNYSKLWQRVRLRGWTIKEATSNE